MDNRNPFERQLADEIDYEVGPPRNVDALAITRQARSTSPSRRFFTMSSTIKFAAAASILAVAGAALYLAVPAPEDGGVAPPGAEQPEPAEPSTPIKVTGTIDNAAERVVSEAGGVRVTEGGRWETDDPRLTGTATVARDVRVQDGTDYGFVAIRGLAIRIENEAGWWSGEGTGVEYFGGSANPEFMDSDTWPSLTGAGEYEGLSAYVILDVGARPATIEGVIYAGEPPPFPELPTE